MAESSGVSGRGRAAWPLVASFGLLALAAVFGGPLLEARGFADGAAVILTALMAALVVGMLLSGRRSGKADTGSTAGVLSAKGSSSPWCDQGVTRRESRGKGMTSRMWSAPLSQLTTRSTPRPNPP